MELKKLKKQDWSTSTYSGEVPEEMRWKTRDMNHHGVRHNRIVRQQKPFARFQMIDQQLIKERKIKCGAAMFKSVETRFTSQVSMTERVMQQKKVFKTLAKDELFLEWLGKQPKVIRLEVQALVCMTLLFSYFQCSYFPVYFIVIFLCVRNIYYIIYYIIYV